MLRRLVFLLSLPERMIRAVASVLGGSVLVMLGILLPAGLKGTTIYRILIGDGLRFIIERVAGLPAVDAQSLPVDYQQRKLIGGAIEGLGLLAVQFSPLWVFALAGDAAAGSQVFIHRLAAHLEQQGVLESKSSIDDLTGLLEALQAASRQTAGLIDTPPLSRSEIDQIARELKASYGKVFKGTSHLLPRLETLWNQMNELAATPSLSLDQLALVMGVEARAWFGRGHRTAKAIGATGMELFGEQVLEGYQRTLDDMKLQGSANFLSARITPYCHAASAQFQPAKLSWTEGILLRAR